MSAPTMAAASHQLRSSSFLWTSASGQLVAVAGAVDGSCKGGYRESLGAKSNSAFCLPSLLDADYREARRNILLRLPLFA